MKVRIDTKNWLGNYGSRVKEFENQRHLDNYLAKANKDHSTSKIIGVEILTTKNQSDGDNK
jgi:hypothetical protein